jgi:hypothetical protein
MIRSFFGRPVLLGAARRAVEGNWVSRVDERSVFGAWTRPLRGRKRKAAVTFG